MKRFFLLAALILLTSCATKTGQEAIVDTNVPKNISKQEFANKFHFVMSSESPMNYSSRNNTYYDPERKVEIVYPTSESIFYVFNNVSRPSSCTYTSVCDPGDGRYDSHHYSLKAALDYVNSAYKKSNYSNGNIRFTTSIGKHKNTCKELGFIPGTEKFGDCALKLIELEVAQQGNNKAVQQIQIVKQQPAYDGWMGELGLSILRGDFSRKTQQPAYRFPVQQKSVCRFQNNGFAQPTLNCTTR